MRRHLIFIVAIAALLASSCTTIYTFGDNTYGQLGRGSGERFGSDEFTPLQIDQTTAVTLGKNHTCALRGSEESAVSASSVANSTLWCWGRNNFGQLGDGTTTKRFTPVAVGTAGTWIQVSAGYNHTCGILGSTAAADPTAEGTLWCWGRNATGQLGIGNQTDQTQPVQVGAATDWVSVGGGEEHTCATNAALEVWCWGRNNRGQLGNGTTSTSTSPILTLGPFATSSGLGPSLGVGANHNCVNIVTAFPPLEGERHCWGKNSDGQLGDGTTTDALTPSITATDLTTFQDLDLGENHSCVGYVFFVIVFDAMCWGDNAFGQLGDGTTTDSLTPVNSGFAQAAGGNHTCGFDPADPVTTCFGLNADGQVGDGTNTNQPTAVAIEPDDFATLSLGLNHSCGIRNNNELWCWGDNAHGQLGDGTSTDRNEPVQIGFPGSVRRVTAGENHSCRIEQIGGLGPSGGLWCWGQNASGQVGIGTTSDVDRPTQVGTNTNWTDVSAGGFNTCGVRSDDTLWCWGFYQRVGTGQTTNPTSPAQVAGADWSDVSVGRYSACAIKVDGTLWCWGDNALGQLGDGTNTNSLTPVQVGSDTDWDRIDVGQTHACGIRTNEELWCWGRNQSGQLGAGPGPDTNTPGRVNTWEWKSVSAGHDYTCGILESDDTLWCWGANNDGQLGNGTFVSLSFPFRVGSDTDWVSISSDFRHSCGLRTTGLTTNDLYCWGDNSDGQLGITGAIGIDRTTPQFVDTDESPFSVATGRSHTVVAAS